MKSVWSLAASVALVSAMVFSLGCGAESHGAQSANASDNHATDQESTETEQAETAAAETAESRTFGGEIDHERALTPLATVFANPEAFAGQTIRTEGEIAQVCQRMGCWMELRDTASGDSCRVPMAGHSFFLPRDVAGQHAMIEGQLTLRELTDAEREHLEEEGARAVTSRIQIDATAVEIR